MPKCDHCGESFSNYGDWDIHWQKHIDNGDLKEKDYLKK